MVMPSDLRDGPLVATHPTLGNRPPVAPFLAFLLAMLVDFCVPDAPVAEVGEEEEAGEGEEAGEEDEDEDGGCVGRHRLYYSGGREKGARARGPRPGRAFFSFPFSEVGKQCL